MHRRTTVAAHLFRHGQKQPQSSALSLVERCRLLLTERVPRALQAALERLMTSWSESVSATARLWNTPGISEFLIEQEGDKLDPVSSFAELLDRPQGSMLAQQILSSMQTGFDHAEAHLQVQFMCWSSPTSLLSGIKMRTSRMSCA